MWEITFFWQTTRSHLYSDRFMDCYFTFAQGMYETQVLPVHICRYFLDKECTSVNKTTIFGELWLIFKSWGHLDRFEVSRICFKKLLTQSHLNHLCYKMRSRMLRFWNLVKSIFLKQMISSSNPVLEIHFDISDMRVSENECFDTQATSMAESKTVLLMMH